MAEGRLDNRLSDDEFADRTGVAAAERSPARVALSLFAAGGVLAVAAGLLLWWREGADVFSEHLLAAIAWCF